MAISSAAPVHLTDVWIVDSGANRHMTHNIHWFTDYKPLRSDIKWPINAAVGHQVFAVGTGTIKLLMQLPTCTEVISLENVLHVPDLQCNLFSTTLMVKKHGMAFIGDK
jgi:hypothetical protein